jgi:catechol 2,3-dioxygenase-like lactoylglutathione lyase family enzyme
MKKSFIIIITAISFFLLGLTLNRPLDNGLIKEKRMTQVGIIVEDIELAAAEWSALLGMTEVPAIRVATGHESKPTAYMGKTTDATAKLVFFQLDNITIELIEPDGKPSTWKEFLDENGPGIHHIAFKVDEMDAAVKNFEKHGIPKVQHGGWGTGEYAYLDGSKNLSLIIELLENYND